MGLRIRWRRVLIAVLVVLALPVLALFIFQDRLVYFPQPYPPDAMPKGFAAVRFTTGAGQQTAFMHRSAGKPARVWVMFGGNAALALDWVELVAAMRDPDAAVLLVDYPGYGACGGKPSPRAIGESAEAAFIAFAGELGESPLALESRLHVLGHSLGAAAALQFAVNHSPERVVLVSPFTSLRDMARRSVGWPLCWLLKANFDNRARVRELAARPRPPKLEILHGEADEVIPMAMGRELAGLMPSATFRALPDMDHNSIVADTSDLLRAMTE
jgi:pimeloyl-ACP methyl ester carboxylesterase